MSGGKQRAAEHWQQSGRLRRWQQEERKCRSMAYHLSRVEQEVVISFNAEEDTADLYTADPVWIRKMDKILEQNPEQFKPGRWEYYEGKVIAKRYTFPKKFITIRTKARTLTDEQREASTKRLLSAKLSNGQGEKEGEIPSMDKLPFKE